MTGSLGRKSDCAVGKKPHVKSARVLVGERHDPSKKSSGESFSAADDGWV